MLFVADTNILLTYFWKHSYFRNIIDIFDFEFISPKIALQEITRNKSHIMKKTELSEKQFENLMNNLIEDVFFMSVDTYDSSFLVFEKIVNNHMGLQKDIDFLALADRMCCSIWTNDKEFKKQNIVNVISTDEFLELL